MCEPNTLFNVCRSKRIKMCHAFRMAHFSESLSAFRSFKTRNTPPQAPPSYYNSSNRPNRRAI